MFKSAKYANNAKMAKPQEIAKSAEKEKNFACLVYFAFKLFLE